MHEIEVGQYKDGKWGVSIGDVRIAVFQTQLAAKDFVDNIIEQNEKCSFVVIE